MVKEEHLSKINLLLLFFQYVVQPCLLMLCSWWMIPGQLVQPASSRSKSS